MPDPVLFDPVCLSLVGLCSLLGPLRSDLIGGSRISYAYPFVLATMLLFGLGPAVLGALVGAGLAALIDRQGRADRWRFVAYQAGRAALVVALAGAAFRVLGGSLEGGLSRQLIQPLLGFTIAFCLIDVIVGLLEELADGIRAARRPWLFPRCLAVLAGTTAAPAIVAIHQQPAARLALLLIVPFVVVRLARPSRVTASIDRPHISEAVYPTIVRALATARALRDDGDLARLERIQHLCLAVGGRLELSDAEMQALAGASALHDVGRLAVDAGEDRGGSVHAHPRLATEIVGAIGFPYPVREFIEHQDERWDGRGRPARLRAHDIPMGSRILAVVVAYERIAGGGSSDAVRARAFVRGQSGTRFDPLVVEVLLDEIDREVALLASGPEAAGDGTADRDRIPLTRVDRELRVLEEIRRTLALPLGLDQRLTLSAAALSRLMRFDDLAVLVVDPATGRLGLRFAQGRSADELPFLTLPHGSVEQAVSALAERLPAHATLPLMVEGWIAGAMIVYREDGQPFSARERRSLVCLAGQVAQAVVRPDPVSARSRSLTDPLTGLPNASYLELAASSRQLREDAAFGLVALHVRGLDRIGVGHGAAVTERLICSVAKRLAAACREDETLVRFGPDEFIIHTPRYHPGALVERRSELCRCIEDQPFPIGGTRCERIRLAAAFAVQPRDGVELEDLLSVLESRLPGGHHERTVLPFRPARSAS